MTKCFQFIYKPGQLIQDGKITRDLETVIKNMRGPGFIIEGTKIIDEKRSIRVRCNTFENEMTFHLRFVGHERFYQEVCC